MRNLLTIVIILCTGMLFAQSNKVLSDPNTAEFAATLSHNNDYLIFQSNRDHGFQLYESWFQNDQWSTPKRISFDTTWSSIPMIGGPSLSQSGDTLYFCAQLESGFGDLDIYFSVKSDGVWGTPINVGPTINTEEFEGFPSIGADGHSLYYTKSIPRSDESTCQEIMVSTKNNKGTWRPGTPLGRIINSGCVKAPTILSDNKTLVFSAKKAPNDDAFYFYKSTKQQNDRWTKPELMRIDNARTNPQHLSVSSDGSWSIYTSEEDLFQSVIPPQSRPFGKFIYSGQLIDDETKAPIDGLIIVQEIIGNDTLLKTQLVNDDGHFSLSIDLQKPGAIEFNAKGYQPKLIRLTPQTISDLPEIVALPPKRKSVEFTIADEETGTGLNVDIQITNLSIDEEISLNSLVGRDGKYAVDLREGDKYSIEIKSLEGYAFANETIIVEETPATSILAKQLDITTLTATHLQHIAVPSIGIKAELAEPLNEVNRVIAANASTLTIPVKPLKTGTTLNLNHIYFDVESYELTTPSYRELEKLVELLRANATIKVEIAAHTDQDGSAKYNQKLSEKRAQSVVEYLKSFDIAEERLVAKGYGESQPISDDPSKNRRVELKVVD